MSTRSRLASYPCVATLLAGLMVAAAAPAAPASEAEKAFQQAEEALHHRELDTAIGHLDAALKLEPKRAKWRGFRGMAWLRKGKYREGTDDLKAAIALNPDDAGQKYCPYSNVRLTRPAREHGRRQLSAMLRDRAPMAEHYNSTEFLRRWAMRRFAGEEFGQRIDWDPSPPLHSDAEHLAPGYGDNAAILIEAAYTSGPNEGKSRSFEELWAGAVYELHNVSFAREFVRLNDEADQGKLSKEEFVAGIVRYELIAAQRTRAFYVQAFLPWAERERQPTEPTLWFCQWWDSSKDVLKSFADKSTYPWRPYARTHDWATVHRYWRHGFVERCRKLLEQMQAEKGYDEEQADLAYWRGRCLARVNKIADAVAAFTDAIRLDPAHAEAFQARGELYQKLGEVDRAKADLAKARELEEK